MVSVVKVQSTFKPQFYKALFRFSRPYFLDDRDVGCEFAWEFDDGLANPLYPECPDLPTWYVDTRRFWETCSSLAWVAHWQTVVDACIANGYQTVLVDLEGMLGDSKLSLKQHLESFQLALAFYPSHSLSLSLFIKDKCLAREVEDLLAKNSPSWTADELYAIYQALPNKTIVRDGVTYERLVTVEQPVPGKWVVWLPNRNFGHTLLDYLGQQYQLAPPASFRFTRPIPDWYLVSSHHLLLNGNGEGLGTYVRQAL